MLIIEMPIIKMLIIEMPIIKILIIEMPIIGNLFETNLIDVRMYLYWTLWRHDMSNRFL